MLLRATMIELRCRLSYRQQGAIEAGIQLALALLISHMKEDLRAPAVHLARFLLHMLVKRNERCWDQADYLVVCSLAAALC